MHFSSGLFLSRYLFLFDFLLPLRLRAPLKLKFRNGFSATVSPGLQRVYCTSALLLIQAQLTLQLSHILQLLHVVSSVVDASGVAFFRSFSQYLIGCQEFCDPSWIHARPIQRLIGGAPDLTSLRAQDVKKRFPNQFQHRPTSRRSRACRCRQHPTRSKVRLLTFESDESQQRFWLHPFVRSVEP